MSGRLHADFLTYLRRGNASSVLFFANVTLPGGNLLISDQGIIVPGVGSYEGRVLQWGPIDDGLPRDGNIELTSTFVTFEDVGKGFAAQVSKYGTGGIRGAACQIIMGTDDPTVGAGKFLVVYTGIVEAPFSPSPRIWTLTIHRNDRPLRGPVPKQKITSADAPNAYDAAIYDRRPTLLYGVHDSRGIGDKGAITLPCVDQNLKLWGDTLGWVSYDRVYKNGVLQTSGVVVTRPIINGNRYSLVQISGADPATDVITADMTGYTTYADGTGNVLTGLSALRHAADNWIWGNGNGVTYATPGSVAPFDATLFDATEAYLAGMTWEKVSEVLGGTKTKTGRDVLNDFCKSLNLAPFWTNLGKLAFVPDRHYTAVLTHDEPRLFRHDLHQVGNSFSLSEEATSLVNRLTISYLFMESEGKFTQSLEVRDQLDTDPADEAASERQLPWVHRSMEP